MKALTLVISTTLALTACGETQGIVSVDQVPALKGDTGAQGNTGNSGHNGSSIGLIQIDASLTQCPTGGKVYTFYQDQDSDGQLGSLDVILANQVVCNGLNGSNGTNGSNGINGNNGHSAAFSKGSADTTACPTGGVVINMGSDLNDNGVLDTNEIKQVAIVCNGATGSKGNTGATGATGATGSRGNTGATGQTGPTGAAPKFTPVMPITPCGASSSQYKEVLLALQGGQILSEFSGSATNANLVRNTLIPDGSYYNTDDSECFFTITSSSSGNRSVSWNGSSANGSGPYHAGQAFFDASTSTWTVSY
jgi:hypothetical protein